ncbi:MAG: hypothetical protein K1X78_09855 [Verrucomicrobiaceae bacterium]|nr:hypothetical protein [Verrucomicrobiaceae bacterium]
MHARLLLALPFVITTAAFAADAPPIPAEPIAKKKELLFEDNMNGPDHDAKWHRVVDTFTWEDGALKGTQTRVKDMPAKDGKGVITAHAAVYGLELPTKDSVVEVKIKFDGCTMVDVEFDDRKYTGSHYGHLCRARVHLDKVVIMDEREGSQNEELKKKMQDPATKAEAVKAMAAHTATFPLTTKLEPGKWYNLAVETVGQEMRVCIDGAAVACFKSPGIGHETKSKIELGVAGQSGWFDDIKVFNSAPAK